MSNISEIKTIGVVIADEYEFEPFAQFAEDHSPEFGKLCKRDTVSFDYNGRRIIAVKCGVGKVNAASATAYLAADVGVDAIFNIGLSGAISHFHKNDIVVGISFVECDYDLSPNGRAPGEKPQDTWVYKADEELLNIALSMPGIQPAVCGCGDQFLTDPVKAKFYNDTFGVDEFDMETGAIASVCHDRDLPLLSIRQISDNADDAASLSYMEENAKKSVSLTETLMKLIDKL